MDDEEIRHNHRRRRHDQTESYNHKDSGRSSSQCLLKKCVQCERVYMKSTRNNCCPEDGGKLIPHDGERISIDQIVFQVVESCLVAVSSTVVSGSNQEERIDDNNDEQQSEPKQQRRFSSIDRDHYDENDDEQDQSNLGRCLDESLTLSQQTSADDSNEQTFNINEIRAKSHLDIDFGDIRS